MSRFTAGLNPEQKRAVETTQGPLLVLAGAGTGKTRVITHRIAQMLAGGVDPNNVLAMTFTNKAAGEMRERIGQLVAKEKAADLTVGTFHSFCVRALREHAAAVGIRSKYGICNADDQLVAVKQALRELQIPEKDLQPRVCLSRISLLKNRLVTADVAANAGDEFEQRIGRVYQRYDRALRASGVLDFDDLLVYMVRLLDDDSIRRSYQTRFQYVLVDEYQDTNGPQYEIVKRIGGEHRNVCVVGDDDQSIYGWRGADVSKILNFDQDFPNATVVRLETNYRSTPQIITAANAVIRNNTARHDKALRAHAKDGEEIAIKRLADEETEAIYVVEDIQNRVWQERSGYEEFAILFRTAIQPRVFEMQLRSKGIPYLLVGGMSFFDRKEVRDVLSYLKLVANPGDELSLLRIINTPPRGIGQSSVEKMLGIAAREQCTLPEVIRRGEGFSALRPGTVKAAQDLMQTIADLAAYAERAPLVDLVREIIKQVRYEDEIRRCYSDADARSKRWEAVGEVVNMAEIHGRRANATLGGFLEDVTLSATDDNEKEAGKGRLTLMTLHSAKGLEFDQVYFVGAEEGLLPHMRSIQSGDVAEERRLAYVGITRARKRLTISYTETRARQGRRCKVLPSRFLYELRGKQAPEALVNGSEQAANGKPAWAEPQKARRGKKGAARRSAGKGGGHGGF